MLFHMSRHTRSLLLCFFLFVETAQTAKPTNPNPTISPPAPAPQPTLSRPLVPTYVPSLEPTTDTFTCANVWDNLVDVGLPLTFTGTLCVYNFYGVCELSHSV